MNVKSEQPAAELHYLIQHVAFLLAKQSEQVLQEQLGIGLSQLKILRALQTNPNLKQKRIADDLCQTEASISRQVKIMIGQNLLQVSVNPKNKREHLTQLTAKGAKLTYAALAALEKYHAPTIANLSEKKRTRLADSLESLQTSLEKFA
jgi:DNA-binding MarR family transcriptional regulator